jgi:hypothetical protein
VQLLRELKKDRSGNALGRYRQLALILDKKLDEDSSVWKDAKHLVSFRNHFVHFRPAWDYEEIREGGFVQALKDKITVYRAYEKKFQFPYGFKTYGCAKWSVSTVLAFSKSFTGQMGLTERLVGNHFDFSLP